MNPLAAGALRVLSATGLLDLLAPAMRGRATILMLHRFRSPGAAHGGMDLATLDDLLGLLRRRRHAFIPLQALFDAARRGAVPSGAVAFTIDDGYADFAAAHEVFARHQCPATVFLVTGFLDGHTWLWWDQVEWTLANAPAPAAELTLAEKPERWTWADPAGRARAAHDIIARLKRLPDTERRGAVVALARGLGVTIPAAPPAQYGPLSWDQVRAAEARGASFGPHTITHPILSRTSDGVSREEIAGSWSRLTHELGSPVPIFCYPNGGSADFGPREEQLIRECGLAGAVTAMPGYLTAASLAQPARVPRFACPSTSAELLQIVSGIEHLKARWR